MWSCVNAYRQAFAGDPAGYSQWLSARRTLPPETQDSAPVSKRTL
jgi:hypothetical protein